MAFISKLSINIFKKLQNFLFPKVIVAEKVLQVHTGINYYPLRSKIYNRPNLLLLSQEKTNKILTEPQPQTYFNYRSYSSDNEEGKFDFKPKVDKAQSIIRQIKKTNKKFNTSTLQPNTFREIDALNRCLKHNIVEQKSINENDQEHVIQVPLNTLETVELLHWHISNKSTACVNLPPMQFDNGKDGCDKKLPECEIDNDIKRPPCPSKPPNTKVCPKDLLINKKKKIKPDNKNVKE